jgi:hypothetical protein
MSQIFVSYRRDDLPDLVGRIFDSLSLRFGENAVFRDIDRIEPATIFAEKIGAALRECNVLIALVGPNWVAKSADGQRKIDDEDDWVRTELHMGIALGIPVVPVILNDAAMPRAEQLPKSLKRLAEIQAMPLDSRRFRSDMDVLINVIGRYLPRAAASKDQVNPPKTGFALFAVFGKYRIAFSVIAACSVIAIISVGILGYERRLAAIETEFAEVIEHYDPHIQSPEMLIGIQRALCVSGSELGTVGPQTPALIKIYKDTTGRGSDRNPQKLSARDVTELAATGDCPNQFRNFYERMTFKQTIATPELVNLLNKIPAGGTLPANASESDVRQKIVHVRIALGSRLLSVPPSMADQVTPDLVAQLTRLVL